MKEAFIALVGPHAAASPAITETQLEDALVAANHDFDYTVKVLRAGMDDEALFGKVVRDSYASNCRDPEIGADILSVGGYDLELLHAAAKKIASGRYDPNDRDADQRIVRMAFADFGYDAFALLNRFMPYSAAFYNTETRTFAAGCGKDLESQESYANLFHAVLPDGTTAFSNDEALLSRFTDPTTITPVPSCTFYLDGTFTSYGGTETAHIDQGGLKANYENARGVIDLMNAILAQAADERLQFTINRLFDEYLASTDPKKRIHAFVEESLDDQVKERIDALLRAKLDDLCAERSIDRALTQRYKRTLDDFIELNAVPHYNVIKLGELDLATTGPAYHHEKFEQVLTQIQLDEPVMLIGPAGSGKNFAISQIAEGLGLPMHYTNNASNEFKLTGFIDAGGTYRETEFYKAFSQGGIFFLDEIDNSDPSALIVINSALANGYMAFPHETIERHPDFRCVAAANTWGAGSNLQYVGRNVLDGATLDRFDMVFFDYDRKLERALYPSDELLEFLWAFRNAVNACRIPHIVSTRAIGKCFKKERYGMDTETILRTNVMRGLAQDDLNVIIGAMRDISEENHYLCVLKTLRVDR